MWFEDSITSIKSNQIYFYFYMIQHEYRFRDFNIMVNSDPKYEQIEKPLTWHANTRNFTLGILYTLANQTNLIEIR